MHTLYKYCIGALILFSLTIHPLQAQSPNECPDGLQSVTKIEGFDQEGGLSDPFEQDGIKISNYSLKDGDPTEVIGGDWSRTDGGRIALVKVKAGTNILGADYSPPAESGMFSNNATGGEFSGTFLEPLTGSEGKAVSNIRFCETVCDAATLGEDQIDQETRTLSNTITDDDGVAEFTFTRLDNFTVASIDPSSGFDRSENTWTWNGSGNPPTSVDFTLEAGPDDNSTYFLEVVNDCGTTVTFDPSYEMGPASTKAQLTGNAPNPFSGRTTIEFALPEQSRVTVAVYDVMGRKVATLADGVRSAGTHTLSWNGQSDSGQDLASGIYLVRMQAGSQSSTRRVTIIR